MKEFVSILIALVIGAGCRYLSVPVPAPPTLFGVFLIFCITFGYIMMDRFMK